MNPFPYGISPRGNRFGASAAKQIAANTMSPSEEAAFRLEEARAENRELLNHLEAVTASLDNMLLHLGKHMTADDRRGRKIVLERAQRAIRSAAR